MSDRLSRRAATLALLAAPGTFARAETPARPLRVAVIGGLGMIGFWDRLSAAMAAATGVQMSVVAEGPKEVIVPAFTGRKADLMFIHGGDEVIAMLAAGQAGRVTAWGANEHVVIGPEADPAGVRTATNGAEALQSIAKAQAPFVTFDDPGSHAIVQKLWRIAGTRPPSGNWRLLDEAPRAQDILGFAAARKAYVVAGHIPFAFGKMRGPGLAVLLQGDPAMRRPYVVVEPPAAPGTACEPPARDAARSVDFLASPAGQTAVSMAGLDGNGRRWVFERAGIPL